MTTRDLLGRHTECAALDQLVASVRSGPSRALVLRGEAGVGKSALLGYLVRHASGCEVVRAAGVESEMELAFAGLQQLCAAFVDRLERLPGPQRDALGTAFGLRDGDAPDRFLVGLAVLSLLSDAAEERPLVCVVDDAQWLDAASAQVLAFVARRLGAESVGLVLGVRESAGERPFDGLPELVISGLDDGDARVLLEAVVAGPLDERVRDRIVAETHGNPLALLELPRGRTPAELARGFGLNGGPALSGRIEERFQQRLAELPSPTRLLLLVAAAEPIGDGLLLWKAAAALGIDASAAGPAAEAELVELGAQVRFRHPLARSAAYGAAAPEDRRQVHQALAEATDAGVDPDRRAWHRAQATAGLDEDVAAELERSAARAGARGGVAAGAAFHERAAELTPDPARRARRALMAAQCKYQAGASDAALRLLALAQAGPLDELDSARAQLLHAQITFGTTRGRDAPPLLLEAAKRLEPLDSTLARGTYLDAFAAALSADRLVRGGDVREIAEANGTDWALGFLARSRALLGEGEAAERLYREAVERLGRTRIRVAHGRTLLVYGEWLRRENRRVDAREQLRAAHTMLSDIGMEVFAERARRELLATGETVRKRTVETLDDLTPQELQIAQRAAEGSTNPEIGAQLFLSPRTVEWHLRKVFGKLGISSRNELRSALPDGAAIALTA